MHIVTINFDVLKQQQTIQILSFQISLQLPNVVFSPPKKKPNVGWQINFFFHPNSVKNSISVKNTKKKKKKKQIQIKEKQMRVAISIRRYYYMLRSTKKSMIKVYILFLISILLPRMPVLQLLGNLNIIEVMYDVPSQ